VPSTAAIKTSSFASSRTTAVKLMGSDTTMNELMRAPRLRHSASRQRRRLFSIKAALASMAKWLNGWTAAATFEGEFSSVTRSYAGKAVARYQW
jgi:hypothetical protein